MMLYFSLTGFINGLTAAILGWLVYSKNKSSPVHQRYALFNLAVFFWSVGYIFWPLAHSKAETLYWFRVLHIGAIFIPVCFLHFVTTFLEIDRKKILSFGYFLSFFFVIFVFSNLYIKDMRPVSIFLYWGVPGILYYLFLVMFLGYATYACYILYNAYKLSDDLRKKQQILYILIGMMIGYIGGSSNYLLFFKFPIPPYLNIVGFIYVAMFAFAILKYKLLDIELLIRKTVVFAGMSSFILMAFVLVAMLVSQVFGGGKNLISFSITALIIAFTLRPLETFLINSTDKFLFQKKYEYKQILKAFIGEVITIMNLDQVVNSTLKLLDQTLHPYTAAIFILNKVEDKYQLYSSQGLENKEIVFTSDSKLINFFKQSHQPAVIRQINGIAGVNPDIQQELSKLKAVICFPLFLHDDLIGFISLGRKKSDEDYSKDDLDVLLDLARTESIAVGNAQLLTEAAQAERRAAIGTMAAGINHEIGNPLNIMQTKIQLFKIARSKGLLQNKSTEEILNQAEESLDECLKQLGRISEITRKLSNFAKPSKEFKPQLVSIPNEIDEVLAVIGHDLELERISIEKTFSSDLSKILADKQEVQQIFFNLMRNAGQAIEGAGTISVSALNTTNNKVHIEIQDTGKGIPEDKIHRIFEPFFTTKGPNKGTGLGLSIVRQLVWRNKGEISFRSQPGVGTTFILEFPKGE